MKSQEEEKIIIEENIPLAPYTTFKIGGPARYFTRVKSEKSLLEAINFARKNELSFFVLAGGSNVLISDEGFSGLVVKLEIENSALNDCEWECGAGVSLARAVGFCKENKLSGLEWAIGIPGTVGGAIWGNAGAYGGEMGEIVKSVKCFEIQSLEFKTFQKEDCHFEYRNSFFKDKKNWIIFSAIFNLKKEDPDKIEKKMGEIIKKRKARIPVDPSPGSFFKNPIVKDKDLILKFEKDSGCVSRDEKIPAGWIIDELGFRGKKMGGVAVSEKHANFVINLGNGKAQDVVILTSFIKQQARTKLGIQLQEEIQYIGF